MGRKYGRLAYGKYTYDLWPITWVPIPADPPIEIWVPDTGIPAPIEVWTPALPIAPVEIWASDMVPPGVWDPVPFGLVEVWKPVTFAVL